MKRVSQGRLLAGGGALLLVLVGAAFAPVLANGFVWDDWTNVVAMREKRGLGAAGLRWAFGAFVMGHYQPLTWMSYALEERLLGTMPWVYHASSLTMHLLNTLWVALVGARLRHLSRDPTGGSAGTVGDTAVGLLAAGFFGLHPLRVESVAWATEQRDVLSAFFFLAAVRFYLSWAGSRRPAAYAASLACFVLCVLSKAQVVLPAALLVLDVYPLGRAQYPGPRGGFSLRRAGALVVEKIPFFAVAAAFSAIAVRAQAASGALLSTAHHGLLARAAQAGFGLTFYVKATAAAWSWYPLYERPVPLDPFSSPFVAGLVASAALTVACLAAARHAPALTAAWAWYVILLLPVLGLFQSGVQLVADRYSYLACLGFALLMAAAAALGWSSSRGPARAACVAAVAIVLATWAALSHRQAAVWRDDETLWRHVLRRGPSAMAYNNLGNMAAQRGEIGPAVAMLRRSLETVLPYSRPWLSLRSILELRPEAVAPAEARSVAEVLERSLAFHESSALAHYTLGLALARGGERDRALEQLDEALRLEPGHSGALRARRDLLSGPGGGLSPPGPGS